MQGIENKEELLKRQLRWRKSILECLNKPVEKKCFYCENVISFNPILTITNDRLKIIEERVDEIEKNMNNNIERTDKIENKITEISSGYINSSIEEKIIKTESVENSKSSSTFVPIFNKRENLVGKINMTTLNYDKLSLKIELHRIDEDIIIYPFGNSLPKNGMRFEDKSLNLYFYSNDKSLHGEAIGDFKFDKVDNLYKIYVNSLFINGEKTDIENVEFPIIFTCEEYLIPI